MHLLRTKDDPIGVDRAASAGELREKAARRERKARAAQVGQEQSDRLIEEKGERK